MTRKSPTVLVIAFILLIANISLGHPSNAIDTPYVPVVTCRTIQLQLEDGKPVADVRVRLKVMRTKITKKNILGIEEVVTFKVLKTDAAGKIQFPELNPGDYFLALPKTKKFTDPFFFRVYSNPGDCSQIFVLEDGGFMVDIEQKKRWIENTAKPQ